VPLKCPSEQGELNGGDGRSHDAAGARLADLGHPERHEPADGVAQQEDGVPADGGSLHCVGPSLAVAAGASCAPADRPQVPRPARLAVNPLPSAQAGRAHVR
jgi:hypothetical protein